jgi:hypothetical protein
VSRAGVAAAVALAVAALAALAATLGGGVGAPGPATGPGRGAHAAPSDPALPATAPPGPGAPPRGGGGAPLAEPKPGSGALDPLDVTNLAPERLGTKPWARLASTEDEWIELYRALHAEDRFRVHDPAHPPAPAPEFDAATEAVLVVGLGTRPRMDYALLLEPVAPRFAEARFRLSAPPVAGFVTEVVTRPARAYRIPRSAFAHPGGLVVCDEKGDEIAAFELPRR